MCCYTEDWAQSLDSFIPEMWRDSILLWLVYNWFMLHLILFPHVHLNCINMSEVFQFLISTDRLLLKGISLVKLHKQGRISFTMSQYYGIIITSLHMTNWVWLFVMLHYVVQCHWYVHRGLEKYHTNAICISCITPMGNVILRHESA